MVHVGAGAGLGAWYCISTKTNLTCLGLFSCSPRSGKHYPKPNIAIMANTAWGWANAADGWVHRAVCPTEHTNLRLMLKLRSTQLAFGVGCLTNASMINSTQYTNKVKTG